MIVLSNLNKYYNKGKRNEIHILKNISLTLPDTGFVTLLGSSGAGKTTLLNVIGGLDKAKGKIKIDDFEIDAYKTDYYDKYRQSNIGYIFQNYNLLYDETVYDNLKVALDIIGVTDQDEQEKRISYCLKAVGMYNFRKKSVNALSGGQQQRVSIARALVKKSKLIIADEPTGNLDSKNSIDVMNILKSLSTQTLILLVTHNRNLAYKYSDKIYDIKDGSVASSTITDGLLKDSLDDNAIDLSKLNHQSVNLDNISFDIYFEDKKPDLNLKLIYKNNQYYIDIESSIKSIEDSKLELIDSSIEQVKVESIDFDNSFYQNQKKRLSFKGLLGGFRELFKETFVGRKIKKVLNISLALIGMILAFSIIMLTISSTKNAIGKSYNRNYQTIVNEDTKKSTKSIVKKSLADNSIDNLIVPIQTTISFYMNINYTRAISTSLEYRTLPYQSDHVKIDIGKAPDKDSVLVSRSLIEEINENYNSNYRENNFLGRPLVIDVNKKQYSLIISGITDSDQGIIYVDNSVYEDMTFNADLSNNIFFRDTAYERKDDGTKTYKIVKGRDVYDFNATKRREILVNSKYFNELPKYIEVNYFKYLVVGSFEYPIELERETYITNNYNSSFFERKIGYTIPDCYIITSGRDVQNDNEIIVRSDSTLELGEYYLDYKIVGKYTGSGQATKYAYISSRNSALCENYDDVYLYDIENLDSFKTILKDENVKTTNWYESLFVGDSSRLVFTIISSILLAISGFFVYFIVKSMIMDEKNQIVVYRSLGKSRISIYKRAMLKIFLLTTFTCLLGYISMILLYQLISFLMSDTFGIIVDLVTLKYVFMGIGFMYLIVAIFGSIPYVLLLRKTPIEILSEYDI